MADITGISRRTMIKGLGAAAWAAPTVMVMRPLAAAAVSPAPGSNAGGGGVEHTGGGSVKRTGPPPHANAGGKGSSGPPQQLPGRRVQRRVRRGWDD